MAILNYTTKVDAVKTVMEITSILVKIGATKIVSDYETGLPSTVTFCLQVQGQMLAFCLPCNYEGVLKAMHKDPDVRAGLCTKEQALRVSWRILKDWIEAQGAIIESQLVKPEEVFLPYLIMSNGSTLFKELTKNGYRLLGN